MGNDLTVCVSISIKVLLTSNARGCLKFSNESYWKNLEFQYLLSTKVRLAASLQEFWEWCGLDSL